MSKVIFLKSKCKIASKCKKFDSFAKRSSKPYDSTRCGFKMRCRPASFTGPNSRQHQAGTVMYFNIAIIHVLLAKSEAYEFQFIDCIIVE